MGKTYIFFEPHDKAFFNRIANIYGELIKKYYKDAVEAYSKGDSYVFFRNYYETLLFPACDYNVELQCQHTVCGPGKCPVLTEDQRKRVIMILKDTLNMLRAAFVLDKASSGNIIIDKIRQNVFFLLDTNTELLDYSHDNTLALYLQFMRGIGGKTDAEKLVYVCPEADENYECLNNEMLKSGTKALDRCTSYQ
jgi:hypothetical protein